MSPPGLLGILQLLLILKSFNHVHLLSHISTNSHCLSSLLSGNFSFSFTSTSPSSCSSVVSFSSYIIPPSRDNCNAKPCTLYDIWSQESIFHFFLHTFFYYLKPLFLFITVLYKTQCHHSFHCFRYLI